MRAPASKFVRAIFGSFLVGAFMLAGLSWYALANDQEKKSKPDFSLSAFMRKKLDASSQILEGLTTEDATLIQQGANALLEMSKAEKWKLLFDSEFRSHDVEFRENVRKLRDAADKNNFDNAALQWFDVTKSCIECHQEVRRVSKAK